MPKPDPAEAQLARIAELWDAPEEECAEAFRRALTSGKSRVVAKAAEWVAERGLRGFAGDLETAFDRFMVNPAKSDPGCLAKLAVVRALHAIDLGAEDLFLRGLRHVQPEATWGRPVDTAADLRGACAIALVARGYRLVRYELVTLLADPEPQARRAAVKAFTLVGDEASELVLRTKALAGDESPEVLELCLSGLMQMDADRSLPFVAKFLEHADPVVVEGAALAVAESHHPEAFRRIRDRWERCAISELRRALALPMALLRTDESFDFLVQSIVEEPGPTAAAVVEALELHRGDPARRNRIRDAVRRRGEDAVSAAFAERFAEET